MIAKDHFKVLFGEGILCDSVHRPCLGSITVTVTVTLWIGGMNHNSLESYILSTNENIITINYSRRPEPLGFRELLKEQFTTKSWRLWDPNKNLR